MLQQPRPLCRSTSPQSSPDKSLCQKESPDRHRITNLFHTGWNLTNHITKRANIPDNACGLQVQCERCFFFLETISREACLARHRLDTIRLCTSHQVRFRTQSTHRFWSMRCEQKIGLKMTGWKTISSATLSPRALTTEFSGLLTDTFH